MVTIRDARTDETLTMDASIKPIRDAVSRINALIFEMATRGMVFSRFEVRVTGEVLYGTAWGEDLDRSRHERVVEVKGASYTALRVARDQDNCWHAACVVDV